MSTPQRHQRTVESQEEVIGEMLAAFREIMNDTHDVSSDFLHECLTDVRNTAGRVIKKHGSHKGAKECQGCWHPAVEGYGFCTNCMHLHDTGQTFPKQECVFHRGPLIDGSCCARRSPLPCVPRGGA